MKNLLQILLLGIIYLAAGNKSSAQVEMEAKYENMFFALDFEDQNYELADVQKYFFTTFAHDDPTQGDVVYDRLKWSNDSIIVLAENEGLYGYVKSRPADSNFESFRLTSKPYYNLDGEVKRILFVFKGKLPSAKGVWPAWWLNGSRQPEWLYEEGNVTDDDVDKYSGLGQFYNTPSPVNCTDWPSAGEVDIIENINGESIIHNTIHTCPEMCESEWNGDGIRINCANATARDPNSGCSGRAYPVSSPEGTFACLWEKTSIRFYYWEPGAEVKADGGPLSDSPDPDKWNNSFLKNYVELFETEDKCNEELYQDWQCEVCKGKNRCEFANMKMIFNITLCGIWAGNEFDRTEKSLSNCKEYIMGEGKELIDNQFMKIEYVSVTKLP